MTRWEAHVDADRDYSAVRQVGGDRFPAGAAPKVVALTGDVIVIGRRSRSGGVYPQVDLSVLTKDPGVSAIHAIIERRSDGSLQLADRGSRNGTRLNGDTRPIERNSPVKLRDGDQIFVGAWSRITIRRVTF